MTEVDYNGPERRHYVEPIHRARWIALFIWIVVFTVLVFFSIRENRNTIYDLKHTKANVMQLEKTNCDLRAFLTTARNARVSEGRVNPKQRKIDLTAAKAYQALIDQFPKDDCARLK